MLGAIIGDIAGSRFEWKNHKSKSFDLLTYKCSYTDDSVMTLAIAEALMNSAQDYHDLAERAVASMQKFGRKHPHAGYGGMFARWLIDNNPQPYNSFGNGAAMRVSPVAHVAGTLDQAKALSAIVTGVTHNHPEGIKGAEATAVAIWMALHGKSILEIRDYINEHYYPMDFTLDGIRDGYEFDVTCQGSVPVALMAFFESTSFEDTIRNAISVGGDSDTIAAIAGGIAEAYYGIPDAIRKQALTFLTDDLRLVLNQFEAKYGIIVEKDSHHAPAKVKAEQPKQPGNGQMSMFDAFTAADQAAHADETETAETSFNRLCNHLFQACNILRGPINQDDYKSYVIPILFFKRISDVYDEETEDAKTKYGDDIAFYSEEELHAFSIPDGVHWKDVRQTAEDVGRAIVNAMMAIEQANPDTLSGLFSSFDDANWTDKTKLTDERLRDLIEHMSALPVGNRNYSADVMGDAYEYLIKKFADMSKKNAGEFYTPRSVVKLMVRLLKPKSGESVYEKTLPTLIQTNETKKSTQIDAFFESKPKIDAFLKIDANAQRQEYKMAS